MYNSGTLHLYTSKVLLFKVETTVTTHARNASEVRRPTLCFLFTTSILLASYHLENNKKICAFILSPETQIYFVKKIHILSPYLNVSKKNIRPIFPLIQVIIILTVFLDIEQSSKGIFFKYVGFFLSFHKITQIILSIFFFLVIDDLHTKIPVLRIFRNCKGFIVIIFFLNGSIVIKKIYNIHC